MQDRPTDLAEPELIAACRAGWGLEVVDVAYLPVGAGSYHWSVTGRDGAVWFVKVDEVGREAGFEAFRRSFETALALRRDCGLDFVLAPVPARDGAVLRRLSSRYAVTVFPMIDGSAGHFGPHRRADRPEMARLLARLHLATPAVAHLAPRADLRLPGRERLHEALADLDRPWTAGPHAEPARRLLATHADRVRRRLVTFDRLVGEVGDRRVVTHGEPHPGNVLWTPAGIRLIDWGSVQLAPPERDLWMLTSAFTDLIGGEAGGDDDEVLACYTEAGGHAVTAAGIALYGQWWALADIAAFVEDLRRPHGDGADAAAALTYLTGYLESAFD
ncbi:phosphotransferase enzyme family protein [Actinoplanes sp. NPDC049599]|uniref:phosphotransferase enzyme family protein n=1 Tax=Actinoplanes sp. NPDC049599 TaxID=3363903 RepID=UPI0037A7BB9A